MLTPENRIRLCEDCPNREDEGTSEYDPITGDLVDRRPRYMNARAEFIQSPAETPEVPSQEFATIFVDTEGNQTSAFLPGVKLEDIGSCEKPIVSGRGGFMYRKKYYDCGAQALKLCILRKKLE